MSTTSVFNLEARARRNCIASGGGGGGAPLSAACATLAERGRAALVCEPSPPATDMATGPQISLLSHNKAI